MPAFSTCSTQVSSTTFFNQKLQPQFYRVDGRFFVEYQRFAECSTPSRRVVFLLESKVHLRVRMYLYGTVVERVCNQCDFGGLSLSGSFHATKSGNAFRRLQRPADGDMLWPVWLDGSLVHKASTIQQRVHVVVGCHFNGFVCVFFYFEGGFWKVFLIV